MTFSNNPEKLSLFGGGCNESATFSELFRLVWRTRDSCIRVKAKDSKETISGRTGPEGALRSAIPYHKI